MHLFVLLKSIKFFFISFRWTYNTPPDSPRGAQYNEVVYEVDIYAIPSIEGILKKKLSNLSQKLLRIHFENFLKQLSSDLNISRFVEFLMLFTLQCKSENRKQHILVQGVQQLFLE